jgi:chemotaxis protein methyltransferase CheR
MKTTRALTADQLQQLCDLIESRSGIRLGDATHRHIEQGVTRLMRQLSVASFAELMKRAKEPRAALRDQLINALISRETHWLRDPECFRALAKEILPPREERLQCGENDRIRIWSAGCSTGQEPYSLVMAVHNRMWGAAADKQLPPSMYEILATDVSPSALFLAVAGRYNRSAMAAGLPEEFVERYFNRDGLVSSLRSPIRRAVRFRQRSLQDPIDGLASGPFDIVLLRYVLAYYSAAAQANLLRSVAGSMALGGMLVLGAAERPPEGLPFEAVHIDGYDFFRRH